MKPSQDDKISHFIAINMHAFHHPQRVEHALHSTLLAAAKLRASRDELVKVICFINSGNGAEKKPKQPNVDASLEVRFLHEKSNGASLNRQIETALADQFTYFYRVDADDITDSHRFVHQAQKLRDRYGEICGGGLTYRNITTNDAFDVIATEHPRTQDYLANCYFLHPVIAFNLSAISKSGLRYWHQRLEDQHLALQARELGLRVYNDPHIYGVYNLDPEARNSKQSSDLSLRLNISFLKASGERWKLPAAWGIYLMSRLFSSQRMRNIRQKLRSVRGKRI